MTSDDYSRPAPPLHPLHQHRHRRTRPDDRQPSPLRDLHACVSERLHTVLNYLTLMACTSLPDYAERDINTVTNIARLMIQDITDVFAVIEQRGLGKD